MSSETSFQRAKWRILCIDDDPEVLEVLRIALGTKHEVVLAGDGVEAIGLLDLCEPDFVVCDVRMPKMDGFQTVQAIRRHPTFYNLPVFFLTAEKQRAYAQRGFSIGANLYLTKPFDPARLLKHIDLFLEECGGEPREKRLGIDAIASAASGGPAFESAESRERPRVILITHHPTELQCIATALEATCEVVACIDPLAALQRLFRCDPDLLILNPGAEDVSAEGLIEMVRGNKRLARLPILLVEDASSSLDAEAMAALSGQPPLEAGASEDAVREAVRRIVHAPGFQVRPKSAPINQLLAEEERLRRVLASEQAAPSPEGESMRERCGRIQAEIDESES